jgi:hypothetical protein
MLMMMMNVHRYLLLSTNKNLESTYDVLPSAIEMLPKPCSLSAIYRNAKAEAAAKKIPAPP